MIKKKNISSRAREYYEPLTFISVIFAEIAIILSSFEFHNDVPWFNVCCPFYFCISYIKICDAINILKKNNRQKY